MEAEVHMLNGLQSADQGKDGLSASNRGDALSKSNVIKLGLEKNISEASKQKIYSILDDVNKLSDVEKLLLYLKLPTGVAANQPNPSSETGFQRDEHQKALRWLRTHLEEDCGTCVQKQELFDQYRSFCERHNYKCVNQFDFGKLLRHLFPRLKLRHLGQRGQSKYPFHFLINHLGEDSSITQAACELVCEWAQKLHDNKHFSSIQELAEHLIHSCVVSTHSTAAFTIIAAAQRDDRNIISGDQDTSQSNINVAGDQITSHSTLQPKTQLQLQRTLKGRKMLREQKEKMECQTTPTTPKSSTTNNTPLTPSKQDSKNTATGKKTNIVQMQKNILPKCGSLTEMGSTPKGNPLMHHMPMLSESALTANTTASSVTSGGHVFVLPSQVSSAQIRQEANETNRLVHHQQMVIVSSLNKAPTNQAVSFIKEKSQTAGLQSSPIRSTAPKTITTTTGVTTTTNRSNSALAMLLTERLDKSHMVLSPSNSDGHCKIPGSENMVKLLRSSSTEASGSLSVSASNNGSSCSKQSSPMISGSNRGSRSLGRNKSSEVIMTTVDSSVTRMVSSLEHGSQAATVNNGKTNKGKRRMTPPKNRQSSKTVSTLLKETRGYGPVIDMKGFVNDRRPVSQLLKECRQRRTSGEEANSPCIVIAPAPTSRSSVPTQPVNITLVANQQVNVGSTLMPIPAANQQSQPGNVLLLNHANISSNEECRIKSNIVSKPVVSAAQSTVRTSQNAPIQFSGSTQMPFAKQTLDMVQNRSHCSSLNQAVVTDSIQSLGKVVSVPGAYVGHQDGNNNEGLRHNKSESYNMFQDNVTQTRINSGNVKDEVSVTNIENDALNEYLANELSSDLADITPSLTMESHSAAEEDQLGSSANISSTDQQLTESEISSFRSQNFTDQEFVMQHNDLFMCYPDSQKAASSGLQALPDGQQDEEDQYGQRPASEQMVQNPDVYSVPANNPSTRPSTMPPELDITYSNNLQTYLIHNQPSSVSGVDHNSTDSFSGYNTPSQMTPASQSALTRSPSLCSAPSTPPSMLSPPDRFSNTEPTNSFMPIQGNMGSLQLDQVSPIRPMVRNMANSESHPSCKYPNSKSGVKDLPRFTNPAASVIFGGSFVPYSTTSGEQTAANLSLQHTKKQQQQTQQQNTNLQQDNFLPVSFIRPVKRPMTTSQQGGQKRVRHRSAQDAKSLYKAQAKSKANKYNMLTSLLRSGSNLCQPAIQVLCEATLQKAQSLQRPNTLPKPLLCEDAGNNIGNPQSPFSPEVENIMAGDEQAGVEGTDALGLNVFRSHSVPAQSLQRVDTETPDFISQLIIGQPQPQDVMKINSSIDISSLLQEQITDEQNGQGLEFGARRNINDLLQDDGASIDNFYSPTGRGDHMISGASVRTSQQQVNAITNHILAIQRARKLASYPSGGVGTPPPSQNPTPDFSTELSTMGDNGNSFPVGRVTSSTLIDTPNSLDTLTTQDSQESLKEDLLVGMCVETEDMSSTLTQQHHMEYVQGSLTSSEQLKLLDI
ncbi:hypothetical protein LSH36_86g02045 [Paralvinella palmiformis]|uniref:RFX-type winged-helix domain-containing protein n=1 Tax=Paralvinella palmiformis TaxID=53620 RepID=A0AAD9NDC4_9ANNE|nr:hypothetical protein LSH36_86g02045 [Paralvinella palmiformis]